MFDSTRSVLTAAVFASAVFCCAALAQADVLYTAGFEGTVGSQPNGWAVLSGSGWQINPSGTYHHESAGGGSSITHYTPQTGLSDIGVEMTFSKLNGAYPGPMARVQNTSNFYYSRLIGTNTHQIYKWSGGAPVQLATATLPAGDVYTQGEQWKIDMVLYGNTITSRLYNEAGDKVSSLAVEDSSHASGTVGIRNGGSSAHWADIDTLRIVDGLPGAVIKTSDGNGADSYVETTNTSANHGTATDIRTKNAGVAPGSTLYRKGYLRFDLTSLEEDDVDAAILELTVTGTDSSAQTFNLYGLNDGDAGENWGETLINWNNAPANTSDNSMDGSATLLTQFDGGTAGETLSIFGTDIADFINADSDGLVTFILTRDTHDTNYGGSIHSFLSKEYADVDDLLAPTLTLIAGPLEVPEPSTLAMLLGLGGVGLLGYLRSRRRAS